MKNRRRAFIPIFIALTFAVSAFIVGARDTLLYPFFKPDFSCPIPQSADDLPQGTFQLLRLYWDGSRLLLEREQHNARLQDGSMTFPDRDGKDSAFGMSKAESFSYLYGGDVASFIDEISQSGDIIGILRYANTFYYVLYQTGGGAMITGFPAVDETPALTMTWEQFCYLAYSHHTGEDRSASGGNGLFGL